MKKHLPGLAFALALLAAVVVSYLPALEAGFVWNDNTYITENPTLDGDGGLGTIWADPRANEQYYPLVFTSYWIEKRLWGLHPFGYHLVNVLLHAGAALLLWRLLLRLGLPGAWLAAAVFALHPVCVESVAWVTERKNTLSMVLSLLAAHAWLAWRAAAEARAARVALAANEPNKRKRRLAAASPAPRPELLYALALAAFTLALFAKTTASVLPPVLLVTIWWREGRLRRSDVRSLVPFFGVGLALAFQTAWLERTMVGAAGQEWGLSLPGHLILAGRAVAFYAGKFFWPAGLAFIYPRWTIEPRDAGQWIPAAAALLVLGAAFVLRKRLGRGPLAALLLFGGVVFPAMGFFNVYAMRYSYVADHFAYQAMAVASACVIGSAASLVVGRGVTLARGGAALGVAGLALLGALSFRQGRAYRDGETLWKETLAKNPACFICLTNYGDMLVADGRIDEAVARFEESLRVKPGSVPTLLSLARALEKLGRFDEAAGHLRAAVQADPADMIAHLNLGVIYTRSGKPAEALKEYQEALRVPSPEAYLAHNGLGATLMGLGRTAEAIEEFRATVALRPDYERGRANLERALAMAGVPR